MSAGIAVIVGPLLELLGPALKRFAATTAGLWTMGAVVATGAAIGVYYEVAALGPIWRALLGAVTLVALAAAWVSAGVGLGIGRAAGTAAEEAVRKHQLARKLADAAGERLAGYAKEARDGTAGAGLVGKALVGLERLPLADAEGFLRRAIDSLLGEGLPGESPQPDGYGEGSPLPGQRLGKVKAAILNRIRAVALAKVHVFLLCEFRREGGGGVDVPKVFTKAGDVVDGAVADMLRAQVRRATVLVVGGLVLASALVPVAALYAMNAYSRR